MKKVRMKNIDKLRNLGIFDLQIAMKVTGASRSTIFKWIKDGKLNKTESGLYLHPESKIEPQYEDYICACKFFGKDSAVGGLTALFYYGLIEQVPSQIWMIVSPENRTIKNKYKIIRTKTNPKIGIKKIHGFRMTSIERTLIESLKFATKIGVRIAIGAIRKAIKDKKTTEVKIGKMARELNMWSTLEKYWETFVE
jgi:predicted transcriptional regulator of viral defense system